MPLETLMRFVLENSYQITGSYGVAVICVSLTFCIGVLPLYIIVDRLQDKEREIQYKMKSKLDEFKSVYKGAVLHAHVKNLYRLHGYHPVCSLRSLLGLVVQIPFFIAAYHLLSNHAGMNGNTFLIFNDLAKPDGLLKIAGHSLNIMPFVMTGINLASAFIYGKKISFKENIQLYVMALVFLVLLYASPSGLLLYWTCNNIFNLTKNIVYRIISKSAETAAENSGKKKYAYELNKIFLHFARKLYSKLYPDFRKQLLLLTAAIGFIAVNIFIKSDKNSLNYVLIAGFCVMSILVLFHLLKTYIGSAETKNYKKYVYYTAGFVIAQLSFILYLKNAGGGIGLKLAVFMLFSLYGFKILFYFIDKYETFYFNKISDSFDSNKTLIVYILGSVTLSLLLFAVSNLELLASSGRDDFPEPVMFYMSGQIILIILFLTLSAVVYKQAGKYHRFCLSVAAALVSLCGTVNIFVFPASYGEMSSFIFQDQIKIQFYVHLLNFSVLIVIVALLFILIYKKKPVIFQNLLAVMLISLAGLCIKNVYIFGQKRSALQNDTQSITKSSFQKKFHFSKNGRNVIVLMLDRFIGAYVEEALKMDSSLKSKYDGFVWYPRSLSCSSQSIGGIPGILGGYDYDTTVMHSDRTDIPLRDRIFESGKILPFNFNKAGFSSTLLSPTEWCFDEKDKENLGDTTVAHINGNYTYTWAKENNVSLNNDNIKTKLKLFGIFRFAPPCLRAKIYNKGKWHFSSVGIKKNDKSKEPFVASDGSLTFRQTDPDMIKRTIDYYSTLYYLSDISDVDSTDKYKGSYYFLENDASHEPWIYGTDFKPVVNADISYPKEIAGKYNNSLFSLQHLYGDVSVMKVLVKWFEWMKENGVYDNTRIILVSDHGCWDRLINKMFDDQWIPGTKSKGERGSGHAATFHNLFMVKDFNSKGELNISDRFMVNSDVPAVALRGIIDGINPYTDNVISEKKKKIPFDVYHVHWSPDKQEKYKFNVTGHYRVMDENIFKIENWKIISEKE